MIDGVAHDSACTSGLCKTPIDPALRGVSCRGTELANDEVFTLRHGIFDEG